MCASSSTTRMPAIGLRMIGEFLRPFNFCAPAAGRAASSAAIAIVVIVRTSVRLAVDARTDSLILLTARPLCAASNTALVARLENMATGKEGGEQHHGECDLHGFYRDPASADSG